MSTCPPTTPPICQPQDCHPPPPKPPCLVKPVMRGLHLAQTKTIMYQGLSLAAFGGFCVWAFIGLPRKRAYKEYYAKGEFEDWESEMAKKGLFQAVPRGTT